MASTGPWDDTGSTTEYQPSRLPPRRSTLRVSQLGTPGRSTLRAVSPPTRRRMASRMASGTGVHVADKVEDLAASLQATSEVLSTADRMLEHYRDINVEQDEEIVKVSSLKIFPCMTMCSVPVQIFCFYYKNHCKKGVVNCF